MRIDHLTIEQVVDRICTITKHQATFWQDGGWASGEARELLRASRLDRQLSLAHALRMWIEPTDEEAPDAEGRLILAWANLGALVEGTLKLCLTVWHNAYAEDDNASKRKKTGEIIAAGELTLEGLRTFFQKSVWHHDDQRWTTWVQSTIQRCRNGIHAFGDREIDDHDAFLEAVGAYLQFLYTVDGRIPYPDEYPSISWDDPPAWERPLASEDPPTWDEEDAPPL